MCRQLWPPPPSAPALALLLASTALAVAALVYREPVISEHRITNRPIQVEQDGYVSSETCKACHPSQYETWHGSFHRTMTQVATPATVRANFDGAQVADVHGRRMRLERRGDEFWAEFDDPGWGGRDSERPRITRQVVMITGSHHQQIYWYATGHDRAVNVLPGVYLIAEDRWVPRSMVVLHPPDQRVAMLNGHWNAICIACHTTHGKTKFDTPYRSQPIEQQRVDTDVAEFGIACESCHGPAVDHVNANRNPFRRYLLHFSDRPDPTIMEPTRLDPRRGSEVCGQCHSVWEFYDADDERQANNRGFPYRPGDELGATRFVAQPSADRESPAMLALLSDPEYVRGSFWSDGMIRVSGREFNGLIDSPCFKNATDTSRMMTCFSCHTMHRTPDDPRSVATWAATHQVSLGMDGNRACVQCHPTYEVNLTAHTKHTADSTGSSCYNCHMPYTSYGLLKAIRSHTISSPSVRETVETGRPNACNLCHLDRTLKWTAEYLDNWWGSGTPGAPVPLASFPGAQVPPGYPTPVQRPLTDDEQNVAASLLWLLKGDAGQRALTAWSMGWKPAQRASGTSWMPPHLAEALNDPYDAVRLIAYRSLGTLPGFGDLEYDFAAAPRQRVDQALQALERWRRSPLARQRRDPELLVDGDGALKVDAMKRLFTERDNRKLFLRE